LINQVLTISIWWYENGKESGFRKEWTRNRKLTFQGNFIEGNEEIK
jgi:hypothetical protein